MVEQTSPAGIRLQGVSAVMQDRNRGEIVAVRNVDLEVEPGELLTLLGPSGCGKTTTLRMIAGFQEPSGGRIFIAGRDVTHVPANARDIGFVFQNYALFPHLTIFGNVAYGLQVRQRSAATSAAPSMRCLNWLASPASANACRTSSRAASSSAWRWRGRS